MKELNEVVTTKIASMISDGSVEKLINKGVEHAVAEAIKDALRSYGEFGKALTEKIKESIQTASHKIEIPEYNKFIQQVVQEQFIKVLNQNAVDHLSKLVGEIIEPIEGKTTISVLLNKVKEAWTEIAREEGKEEIEVSVEDNSDNTALYVTFTHPQYEDESVHATLYNHHSNDGDLWHIGYISEGKNRITGRFTEKAAICTHYVTDILYKYWAMGTRFEMDTEIENIYVSEY